MVRFGFLTTAATALAALALSGALAPAHAEEQGRGRGQAEASADGGHERGGWRARDGGQSGAAPERGWRSEARAQGNGGGWRQRDGAQPAPQAQREARGGWRQRAEAAPQAPQQRNAPEGGWRSQRPADGSRYGRNWDNRGAVGRPTPAWRGAEARVPERGAGEQRSWRDRDRAAGQWQRRGQEAPATVSRDWSDRNWSGRNRGYGDDARNRTYRDGYRDGVRQDSYRSGSRDGYRSGYRSGSRDGYRSGYAGSYRNWDRYGWRNDRRYDWRGYRTYNRDTYRLGRYYSPYRNWSYSRLNIGFFLEPLFYGNRYWIDDPWQYRLPEVYGPYRWVRYYDDVLLVDIYSGEVVDVIYDFFW